MKKVTGKYDENSEYIGFDAWSLTVKDKLKELIKHVLREGMEIATTKYECKASFPFEWDPDDEDGKGPTTIEVELPIGPGDYENPCWTFELSDLVTSLIEDIELVNGAVEPKILNHIVAVRDQLRQLVGFLDHALGENAEQEHS